MLEEVNFDQTIKSHFKGEKWQKENWSDIVIMRMEWSNRGGDYIFGLAGEKSSAKMELMVVV